VNIAAIVFWTFAIVLLAIGLVFIVLGMNSERGYWRQRDPQGDARTDATKLSAVVRRAGHFAAGEYRAPLRIAAIGVLMCESAVVFAVIALIVTVAA
jgi:thiosulfate reductase cytochrome b subunit